MTILHKAGVWLLLGGAVLTTLLLGYNHYKGLLDEKSTLEKDNATLTASLETEKATVDALQDKVLEWQAAAEEQEERADELQVAANQARNEIRRLNDIFGRHDFTALARAKPGLITNRINAGTQRVFDILECETTTPGRCDADGRTLPDEAGSAESRTDSAAADEVGGTDP